MERYYFYRIILTCLFLYILHICYMYHVYIYIYVYVYVYGERQNPGIIMTYHPKLNSMNKVIFK